MPAPDDRDRRGEPFWQFFDVGPDGTLWTAGTSSPSHHSLARFDGSGWTVFTEADGVGRWGAPRVHTFGGPADFVQIAVAPDGSAWVNAANDQGGCDGLARFDGQTWTPYLAGRCISDFDIAPDGSVWVVARSPDGSSGVNTYVITPAGRGGHRVGSRPPFAAAGGPPRDGPPHELEIVRGVVMTSAS